jgi:hypothetical protein
MVFYRGVIIRSIGYTGAVFNYDPNAMSPGKPIQPPAPAPQVSSASNQNSSKQSIPVAKR